MKFKNKKIPFYLISTLICGFLLTIGIVASNINFDPTLRTKGGDTDYSLVLDSSNKVTAAGDVTQKTKLNNDVKFTYSGVQNSTSGHATLNSGGVIVNKDWIRSIESITADFNVTNALRFRVSYGGGVYGAYTTMESGFTYNIDTAPYYVEFSATSAVTVNQITLTYSCQVNPAAHEGEGSSQTQTYYEKVTTTPSDYSGDYLFVYVNNNSTSYVFDGTSSSDSGNIVTAPTITDNTIAGNAKVGNNNISKYEMRIAKSGSYYTVQCLDSEAYIYASSDKKLNYSSTSRTLSISDGYIYGSTSSNSKLQFNASASLVRFYSSSQGYLDLFKKVTTSSGPSYDAPEESVIGFTATDSKANSYYHTDTFATDNGLTVTALKTGGGSEILSAGGDDGYSYKILNNNTQKLINANEPFGAEGNYTLTISYKNYIPVVIGLKVDFKVALERIDVTSSTLEFNTAQKLSDFTSGISADLSYNKSEADQLDVPYNQFATNNVALTLSNPSGVTTSITSLFGVAGTWTIKVTSTEDSSVYGTLDITVNAIQVQSISVTGEKYSVEEDQTLQLTAAVTPNTATNKTVSWSSNNTSIATVNTTGLVTAKAVGEARITATATDGSEVYGFANITVTAKPKIVDAEAALTPGDYASECEISGEDGVKVGTSKNNGEMTITVGAGATKLSFYAAAWNGSGGATLNFSGATLGSSSISIAADSGVKENSPFTLNSAKSTYYKETTLSNVTSETTITVTSSTRFVLWDAKYYTVQADPIYPTSISLTGTSSIAVGGTSQLNVNYNSEDVNVKNVTFTASNTNVATVSATGLVTGVAAGNSTITARAESANSTYVQATLQVTISNVAVSSVSLNKNSTSLYVGDSETLTATISPSNATNKAVTWTSSNTSVATVSNGVVTAVAKGSATITVRTTDGNKTATCTVSVSNAPAKTYTITYTDLPASYQTGSTVYTANSGIKFNAYNCAGGYSNKMQFKSSGGYLQSTEALALGTLTINNRESNELTVYGSNTAGSFSTTITGVNDVYDLSGYKYFKVMRVDSGAAYCASISISTGTIEPTDPTSISLSPSSLELSPNGSQTLTVSYEPASANQNKQVTWTSSNTNVATVSSEGLVSVKSTATAGQTATITARLTNLTSIYATATVTVVEQQIDDQTILIYLCGSDLESNGQTNSSNASGYATGDLTEILSVSGQPDDVNVVIQTGGAKCWKSTYNISASATTRYHVNNKSLVKDETLAKANMGSSSTLQSFLTWGLQTYPAQRTSLILWNHGGAMRGVCYDENYSKGDPLTNSEVKTALSNTFTAVGRSTSDKLEWIGYDACLMQVQDVAEFDSQYFKYMVASEESEAGAGWDYDTWIDDAYAKKSTQTILNAIVDGFIADTNKQYQQNNWGPSDQTLSWLDLSYMSAYKTAWENMASALNKLSINKTTFQNMMKNVKYYGTDDDSEGYSYFGVFDAYDTLTKIGSNYSSISTQVNAAKTAFNNLVKYSKKGSGAGNSYGMCCFFPMKDNSGYTCNTSSVYTESQTNFTNWRTFVLAYGD